MRRRRGVPEDLALKTALEVASVKAQAQAIIRRLHSDLAALEDELGRLPDWEDHDESGGVGRDRTESGPELSNPPG